MKTYVPKNPSVPKIYEDDVSKLRQFIIENLGINISTADTYQFWLNVSESWSSSWLNIEAHYDDETREEFLLTQLETFGDIINLY